MGIALSPPIASLVLYGAVAFVLGAIPLNRDYRPAENGIDVFIRSNGVHVDLILPTSAGEIDWRTRLPDGSLALHTTSGASPDYLAFGWGDRGFYLATPRWEDLRFATAFSALAGLDSTVLHVEPIDEAPREGSRTRHIRLTPERYRALAAFVEASFAIDGNGMKIVVPRAHYGPRDAFLEARGHYSLFVTCNEWTRRALDEGGVRVPVWAPFDKALLFQIEEAP